VGVSSSKYKIFIGKMLSQQKLNCLDTPYLKITPENVPLRYGGELE
jgi:hypothetical protein